LTDLIYILDRHHGDTAEVGQAGIDLVELKWDLHLALANFFAVFLGQQGWFYPILLKVGGKLNSNLSLPQALAFKKDFTMKVFSFAGLTMHRNPHGWQIRGDKWAKFLQQFKLDTCMEVNRSKVGNQHYFLKIGGDNVHAQPYLQYQNKLVMLDKPHHSFHHARQALQVAISGIPILAKDLKSSFNIDDANDGVNDDMSDDIKHEDNTPTESVTSKEERIVFGAFTKVEVADKQHPLLAKFKK
jgi:hypothetical protein